MDWINKTEEYAGTNGWGARGKFIGISRMLNDSDLTHIQNNKMVSSVRPRGIISGFLAIVPNLGHGVFLPPVAAKMGPQKLRMRLSDELVSGGAIFSAYMTKSENSKTLVIEDVLLWNTQPMWFTKRFEERINTLKLFQEKHFRQDTLLQGCKIVFANYNSLKETVEPDAKHVLEFVPNQTSQKRLIWMKPKEEAVQSVLTARKEVGAGPDVFMIYKDGQKLGQALVRTLVVSRLLRAAFTEGKAETPVTAEFNKQFDKWEITDIPKIA
jgi:hypothetical protein